MNYLQKVNKIVWFLILFQIIGCATPLTPEQYANSRVSMGKSDSGGTFFRTVLELAPHQTARTMWYSVALQFDDDGSFKFLFVYIEESASDWRFYDKVKFNGEWLDNLHVIDRDVTTSTSFVWCEEKVSFISQDFEAVKKCIETGVGIPFTLLGSNGVRDSVVPAGLIQACHIAAKNNGFSPFLD